jgi:hypothetical protein
MERRLLRQPITQHAIVRNRSIDLPTNRWDQQQISLCHPRQIAIDGKLTFGRGYTLTVGTHHQEIKQPRPYTLIGGK